MRKDGSVTAKKFLGQHFLRDNGIARDTAELIERILGRKVLEVGPGMGVLTRFLLNQDFDLKVAELDRESVKYLTEHFPELNGRIIEGDFLKLNLAEYLDENGAVIGNFPYNISSQILFHCLQHINVVSEIAGMFQKEVAERITAKHGNKSYGILSVLMQTYYEAEYMFTVEPHVFIPPPKVRSGVIRLRRRASSGLKVPDDYFKTVVKTAFNQRRKTLRNALKPLYKPGFEHDFLNLRAEQLSIADFARLAFDLRND